MSSSNGNIFRVTCPLWWEYTIHRCIPLTKASDTGHWCFLWSAPQQTLERTCDTSVFETPSRSLWHHCNDATCFDNKTAARAPSQYPKRRLSVRSRQVSKPRDLYLELSDRSEIWQALRQQCCRCACQISQRCDNLKYQSRGFETLRDLTKRRLFGYWDGALEFTGANLS